jgi:NTP pyrophosphatase (non-canonical NTP hydrolase)
VTFDEYQKLALRTAASDQDDFNQLMHWVLGTVAESGEVAAKFQKIIRDKNSVVSPEDIKEIETEIGDVLWYLAVLANHLGLSFETLAEKNIAKLASRLERNQIGGSGDNR